MQDDIDMEPLHKLFIYRKKLVKPYIERLLKWMDGITVPCKFTHLIFM